MNYGPTEYCRECRRVRPKSDMQFIDRNHRRKACGQCREKRERALEELKRVK